MKKKKKKPFFLREPSVKKRRKFEHHRKKNRDISRKVMDSKNLFNDLDLVLGLAVENGWKRSWPRSGYRRRTQMPKFQEGGDRMSAVRDKQKKLVTQRALSVNNKKKSVTQRALSVNNKKSR